MPARDPLEEDLRAAPLGRDLERRDRARLALDAVDDPLRSRPRNVLEHRGELGLLRVFGGALAEDDGHGEIAVELLQLRREGCVEHVIPLFPCGCRWAEPRVQRRESVRAGLGTSCRLEEARLPGAGSPHTVSGQILPTRSRLGLRVSAPGVHLAGQTSPA